MLTVTQDWDIEGLANQKGKRTLKNIRADLRRSHYTGAEIETPRKDLPSPTLRAEKSI